MKWVFVILLIVLVGCSSQPEVLRLATTTSTYDSGLLDYLLPDFEEQYGTTVQVISVGTGQAIKNGENGDVDVILVHAPSAELKFVEEGYGVNRVCVMYNDFIILGPEADPAGVKEKPIINALQRISMTSSPFVSRGDDSGTHKKEKKLWVEAELEPTGDWYNEVGAGMGDTLRIANDLEAYVLADRGTYLANKNNLDLVVLVEGDDSLLNPYGVIAVNPEKHSSVNDHGAEHFLEWLMSEETQNKIDAFRKNGEKLFNSLRGECTGG